MFFVFFFPFSGEFCKAEVDSAGRLLVAGLETERQGLVGSVPSAVLPAKGFF